MNGKRRLIEEQDSLLRASRLARLRRALSTRDWLGIGIELLVVTVGVLLAFEVEQWGDDRNRRREERHLLERLYRETGAGINELSSLVRVHERGVRELGAVLRASGDEESLSRYSQQEEFGCVVGTLPSAGYNDTASQELVASGRISLISDPQLRDTVRELAAAQAMAAQQLAYGRQNIVGMLPTLLPYYRTSLRAGQADTRCTIDWRSLMQKQEAANALARVYRVHQLMAEVRGETLAAAKTVQRQLACSLGEGDCHETRRFVSPVE